MRHALIGLGLLTGLAMGFAPAELVTAQNDPPLVQLQELGRDRLGDFFNRTNAWPYYSGTRLVDVDRDGDLDLVGGMRFPKGIRCVFSYNDGGGVFANPIRVYSGPPAVAPINVVELGDVDGDGDRDLVLGLRFPPFGVRLLLNDGLGHYRDVTATHLQGAGAMANTAYLRDLDGDKDLDLVYTEGMSPTRNHLALNSGDGTFVDQSATHLPKNPDGNNTLAVADVDGDGDLDLLLAYGMSSKNKQDRLYLNDGNARFTDATAGRMPADPTETALFAPGDLDADGDVDLIVGKHDWSRKGKLLYLNDGRGRFTDATAGRMPAHVDRPGPIFVIDVDRDGDLDVIVNNGWTPRHYANNGEAVFRDVPGWLPSWASEIIAVGDVDGDQAPDVLATRIGSRGHVFLNDGIGRFIRRNRTSWLPMDADATAAVAVADVDGDGGLDIVFANAMRTQNRLYLHDGNLNITDATATRLPKDADTTRAVQAVDVDGDGDADLVLGNAPDGTSSGRDRLYLNDGQGTFTDASASRLPEDRDAASALAAGDVDGDRDVDLVVANRGQSRLYLNDGKGRFKDATSGRLPARSDASEAVLLVDVDGDRDLDLVLGNAGQDRLYLNDGKGVFSDVTASRMPADAGTTLSLAVADVDADLDPDLVLGRDGQTRLYLNDGKGKYVDATTGRMPVDRGRASGIALGDLDLDGDPDVVVAVEGGPSRLYLNDGRGTFADASVQRMQQSRDAASAIVLADLDHDGDLDLVLGARGANRLFVNLHRQINAPTWARIGADYTLDVYAKPGYSGPSLQPVYAFVSVLALRPRVWIHPYGLLGLNPTGVIPAGRATVGTPGGKATVRVTIPDAASLIGVTLHAQALVLHIPSRPDLWRLTNMTADVMRR